MKDFGKAGSATPDPYPCDVLVVGAGPAGSCAARAAAEKGLHVVMVENRAKVGVPVRCAEYIPAPLMGEVDPGRGVVAQSVRGMKTILPEAGVKETAAPGFIIHRDLFDQALASAAEAAGARLICATRAVSRDDDGTVVLRNETGDVGVRPRIIIGADGPRSTVGRWVGAVNRNLLPAVQARVFLTRPLEFTEVYLDPRFHAGYGWVFPKSREANVGIGLKKPGRGADSLKTLLNGFLRRLVRAGKVEETVLDYTAGWIPAEPVRDAVYGNVLLAGDAAGHTHPVTGAGIFAAVMAGGAAGRWAARSILENEAGLLKGYEIEWRDLLAHSLSRAYQRRTRMEEKWHRFQEIIKSCWVAYREYYAES